MNAEQFWKEFDSSDLKERKNGIARRAGNIHDSVNQFYDIYAYSYHVYSVVHYALKYASHVIDKTEDVIPIIFGAAFHDTIEDARLTYNDVLKIAKEYMPDEQALVATEIVYALTNEKGKTRAERENEKYFEGIRNTPYAALIKTADRVSNMIYSSAKKSSMWDKYRKEAANFAESVFVDNEDKRFTVPEPLAEYILTHVNKD